MYMAYHYREKIARRSDDEHHNVALMIETAHETDVWIWVEVDGLPARDETGKFIRAGFCNLSSGGGRSRHTLEALHALIEAMKKDAMERPDGIPPYSHYLEERMLSDR